jgi:hypothetical protein
LKTGVENIVARTFSRSNTLAVLVISCLFSVMAGCAAKPYRVNSEWTARAGDIRTLLVVRADVKIYQLSPGGMMLFRKHWSETGGRNLDDAVLKCFRNKHYRVKLLNAEGETHQEMMRILPLYRAVNKSIQLHTYGPQVFPDKMEHFDYSVGSLKGPLDKLHCDAMIFVRGFDQVSEEHRKTYMSLALADTSGSILWYGIEGSWGDHDLRDPTSTQKLVDALLSHFPEAAP